MNQDEKYLGVSIKEGNNLSVMLMAFQRNLKCEGVTEKNDTIVELSNECVDLLPSLVHFCTCFVLEEEKGRVLMHSVYFPIWHHTHKDK